MSETSGEPILPSPIKQPPAARIAMVTLLTLLPWPAVWYGMYELRSIIWSFVLYHFVCLMPAIIWGWPLWKGGMKSPTARQWQLLMVCAVVFSLLLYATYMGTGEAIIDRQDVMKVLTAMGYQSIWLLPLAVYFVVINAALEELFWRGVILNELEFLNRRLRYSGEAWTALSFCAWHWLVLRQLIKPVWAELAVIGVLVVGIICSLIYRKTGSLLLAIAWHALVFDLAVISVFAAIQTPTR